MAPKILGGRVTSPGRVDDWHIEEPDEFAEDLAKSLRGIES
jgi:hypothetical protein